MFSNDDILFDGPWRHLFQAEYELLNAIEGEVLEEGNELFDLDNKPHPPPARMAYLEVLFHLLQGTIFQSMVDQYPETSPRDLAASVLLTALDVAFLVGQEVGRRGIELTECKCTDLTPEEAAGLTIPDLGGYNGNNL